MATIGQVITATDNAVRASERIYSEFRLCVDDFDVEDGFVSYDVLSTAVGVVSRLSLDEVTAAIIDNRGTDPGRALTRLFADLCDTCGRIRPFLEYSPTAGEIASATGFPVDECEKVIRDLNKMRNERNGSYLRAFAAFTDDGKERLLNDEYDKLSGVIREIENKYVLIARLDSGKGETVKATGGKPTAHEPRHGEDPVYKYIPTLYKENRNKIYDELRKRTAGKDGKGFADVLCAFIELGYMDRNGSNSGLPTESEAKCIYDKGKWGSVRKYGLNNISKHRREDIKKLKDEIKAVLSEMGICPKK